MQPWSSALTILDKPKHPQTALARSTDLHEQTGLRLHLVSFCWTSMREHNLVLDPGQCLGLENALVEQRAAWVHKTTADYADDGITTEVVFSNDISGWLSEKLSASEHDLVIKSVNHSETLLHTPLDWHLLRLSPVPVLLCATRKHRPSNNILVAIDPTQEDALHKQLNIRVLENAAQAAQMYGATLHCVCAVEFSEVLSDLDIIDRHEVEKRAKDTITPMLEELTQPFGISPDNIYIKTGKVGRVVAGRAHQVKADLLVLGTAARKGLRGALIGNSAERILTKAPCDVLAIPPQETG